MKLSRDADLSSAGDSTWLLVLAAVAVFLSAVAVSGGVVLHLIGYALASLLAFSLIAIFRRQSVERSATAGIGVPQWVNWAAVTILVVGFLVSLTHSWFIASHFS